MTFQKQESNKNRREQDKKKTTYIDEIFFCFILHYKWTLSRSTLLKVEKGENTMINMLFIKHLGFRF